MKPALIEYDKIFKKKKKVIEIIKPERPQIQQIDNFNFFFNIICFFIVIIGIMLLYFRKKNKIENKRKYNQKVVQFFHDVNSEANK